MDRVYHPHHGFGKRQAKHRYLDGKPRWYANRTITNSAEGESNPQWSPDGKYLSFTASRQGSSQVWLMDRRGGEAQKLTDIKGELSDYAWSPDAKNLVLE